MKITENLLIASRNLRKNQTPWEQKLWYHLRKKQFMGYRFRRQFVVAYYIVDFICFEKNLIIELDGGQHNEKENIIYDNERTKILESQGFRVLRFWNNEIDENIEGVLLKISEYLVNYPSVAKGDISPERGEKNTLPSQGRVARSAGRGQ